LVLVHHTLTQGTKCFDIGRPTKLEMFSQAKILFVYFLSDRTLLIGFHLCKQLY